MSGDTLNQRLVEEFSRNYLGNLFYFCLKKTGNHFEAEDLTSEISLCIISQLSKNSAPEFFSAWVWKIARNQYSKWADRKNKASSRFFQNEKTGLEIADKEDVLNNYIENETISFLRRELAFITKDYRDILIAYYLEDKSIADISRFLNQPEGTIKSRLFRSRKILKEGINMARKFGKMSYNPEDIGFSMDGSSGADGTPWSLISGLLSKNILIAAYRTPSSADELAIELGVALPYMENALDILTNATLIRKTGNVYETNFFIVSADARKKISENINEVIETFTRKTIELIEFQINSYNENGVLWNEGYQTYEDMKWALLMKKVDEISILAKEDNSERTQRPSGGKWDLTGLEIFEHADEFVGLHGNKALIEHKNESVYFYQYKFNYKRIGDKTPVFLGTEEILALAAVAIKDVSHVNSDVLNKLVDYGYLSKKDNTYLPTFWISFAEKNKPLNDEQQSKYDSLLKDLREIVLKHYNFCRETLLKEVPTFLKNDSPQINHAINTIFSFRASVLAEAIREGYISYDEDKKYSPIGAFLTVEPS